MARTLRALGAGLACLVGAIVFAACGGDEDSGATSAKSSRPITFQIFGDPEELKSYRTLVKAYRKQGGSPVKLIEVADREAFSAKLATSFAAKRPPGAFLINYRTVPPYVARGVLDPVGPRLEGSGLEAKDFYEQPLDAFTFDGELVCLPQNVSSLGVYYNRDLFRAAGVQAPARDWTYSDFISAAKRLTIDEDGDGTPERYGAGIEPSVTRIAPWLWAAGGELVDDTRAPTSFELASPASRRGLSNLVALRRKGLAPTATEVESRGLEERFLDGTLAMLFDSRKVVPTLRTIKDFEWDVASFPRDREPATVLHSDGFCIPKGAQADAAWKFVSFAGGPEGQAILARTGRTVPSLRAVAQSQAFLDPALRPASARVYLDAIASMRRLPNPPRWPEIEEAAGLALERLYYGELSQAEAIARIDREALPLLKP